MGTPEKNDPYFNKLKVEILEYTHRLDALAETILSHLSAEQNDNHQVFLMAQTMRIYRFFQAVCILVEQGLNDAAGSVLRVLVEQAYVITAINKEPDAKNLLAKQSIMSNRKAIEGLLKIDQESRPGLTDERLKKELEEIGKQESEFNAYFWANRCGLDDSYRLLYRRLCAYAHGSMNPVSDYVQMDSNGIIQGISSNIAEISGPEYLVCAASILLDAVNISGKDSITSNIQEKLSAMDNEQRAFSFQYFEKRAASLELVDSVRS